MNLLVCRCKLLMVTFKTIFVKQLKPSIQHSSFIQYTTSGDSFQTYQNHCFARQAALHQGLLLRRWTWGSVAIIIVLITQPPQIDVCHIDAVEYDGCNGKSNSCQIQNHTDGDLKFNNNKICQFTYNQAEKPHQAVNSIQYTNRI